MLGITKLFNSFQEMLTLIFSSVDTSVMKVLDRIILVDEKILTEGVIKKVIGTYKSIGTVRIGYTLVYGFLIYFAYKVLINKITNEENESISKFLYKILINTILVLFAYQICLFLINLNRMITSEILKLGKNILGINVSFKYLFLRIDGIVSKAGKINMLSIDGILKAFSTYGMLNLVFVYSLRYVYIKLLAVVSPIIFVFNSLEKTKYIFKEWIKSFLGLLFIQNVIVLILIFAHSIILSDVTLFNKIMCIGTIYALMQVNDLQKQIFGGSSLFVNPYMNRYMYGGQNAGRI